MEALLRRQRLILPIAPIAALIAAALAALAVIAMPINVLEGMATDSGIAALITAAQPPLGETARLAIAFLAAALIGGLLWFGLGMLIGQRSIVLGGGETDAEDLPVIRRADAHPDAPPRRPVLAHRDLGTPFLDVHAEPRPPVERDLPRDLDTPLSAYLDPFDPPLPPAPLDAAPVEAEAVDPLPIRGEVAHPEEATPIVLTAPEVEVEAEVEPEPEPDPIAEEPAPVAEEAPAPREPSPAPRFAPHERIETFELTPLVRPGDAVPPPTPRDESLPTATIHDLLERLERGVARRTVTDPAPAVAPEPTVLGPATVQEESIEQTLAVLRRLAARVG